MAILLSAGSSYVQFVTVLVVFVLVLGITVWVTKWMANYQKQLNINGNVEIVETTRIAGNKYIQLVRVGRTYMAIAVCKDSVTMLCEVPEEQLKFRESPQGEINFKELLVKAIKKDSDNNG